MTPTDNTRNTVSDEAPDTADVGNPRPKTADTAPDTNPASDYVVTWETASMAGDWQDGSYDVGF